MIYEYILSKGKLSKQHKESLMHDRGFDKDTIAKYRFISGGKYLLDIEQDLISSYTSEQLLESGVCLLKNQVLHLSPQLLEDRIIIPYLNTAGKAYLLRPHKLGLSGQAVELYHELNVGKDVILTEGEFKAAAAMQLGFNCIAAPGISSFAGEHFPKLVQFLNTHKVKGVAIMFDNEVKDNPVFKDKYKENSMVRYDTQYFAYVMCNKLNKEGFNTKIATLPDGWRVKGKIDIDGALAMGKTSVDIRSVISRAKSCKDYLKELPEEAQLIVKKKLAKKFFKTHITKDFGKYVATRYKGKSEWQEVISNFTIKILATHDTIDGIIREIQLINEFGKATASFHIAPENMVGSDGFATFCMRKGNFIWRGFREDLNNIWESEFLNDDGRYISEPDHVGWIPSENLWLFSNVAFKDGKELRPDNNGIFWTDKKGVKPIPLGVSSGKSTISEGIPYLNLSDIDIMELREKLSETLGPMEANLCLGWISSIIYMEEVFNAFGCYPFLFVTGRRGSGKSTIAEWLMSFFGVENAGKMASDTTPVAIQRYLSYYSSLPMFIDEYRNTKQVTYKNGVLRNAYNRQSAGKGIKSSFGIREAKIRGSLIISGEETPEDNALLTRCIVVNVSKKNRKTPETNHFNWFTANRAKFSNYILQLLRNKEANKAKYLTILKKGKDYFTKQGSDDRTAINYAIVAAGYGITFDDTIDFAKWLTTETKRVENEYQDEQAIAIFLEDLVMLKTRKLINDEYWTIDGNGSVYLYFHGLHSIWAQEYRKTRGIEPFKSSAIRDYLKEESGFEGMNVAFRIKDTLKKCVVFNAANAPESIKALVDYAG